MTRDATPLTWKAAIGGRRRRAIVAIGFLGLALPIAAPPAALADPARLKAYGKHLSSECTACHRLDGTDNGIPAIVGWDSASFIATMRFYKDGQRNNPAMISVAQSLDDGQLEALAAYFGSLPKSGTAALPGMTEGANPGAPRKGK